MIVWINGAYGSGKTTLVEEITHRRPDVLVLDPEHIGHLLRESVSVPTDNFQDLPSWREIVVAAVLSVQRHHADLLLVPMTLINEAYRREVLGALRAADVELLEVFLDVPADELRRRIEHRVLFSDDPVRNAAASGVLPEQGRGGRRRAGAAGPGHARAPGGRAVAGSVGPGGIGPDRSSDGLTAAAGSAARRRMRRLGGTAASTGGRLEPEKSPRPGRRAPGALPAAIRLETS